MQVLIIPDLYEPVANWSQVKQQLENAGFFTNIYEYQPPRNPDVSEIVEDIHHHLVDTTIVVGFGIGGRIAIQLGAQRPHPLAGILLLSTPAMKAPGVRSYLMRVLHIVLAPFRIIVPYYLRKKLAELYKRFYPGNPKKRLYREIVSDEQGTFLAKIHDPLYLLWGSRDRRVRPEVADVMSETLDYADVTHTVEIVAGAGTALHRSQPGLVTKTIIGMANQERSVTS